MQTLVILGALDPEMTLVKQAAEAAGFAVACATVDGRPVHGGNAYRADGVSPSADFLAFARIVLVECGFAGPLEDILRPGTLRVFRDPQAGYVLTPGEGSEHSHDCLVARVDHHRPGDPGYGRPPEEYAEASSIGQFLRLAALDVAPVDWRLAAAADHCLAAAYRGRCPGVDPDTLMRWRAEGRAAFQGRPVEAVLADIEAARDRLRAAVVCRKCGEAKSFANAHYGLSTADAGSIGGQGPCGDAHRFLEYVDFRGSGEVPELPEAACREDIPFLATVVDPDGRRKVVLQAAGADLVTHFMAGAVVPGLVDTYGDPARGFAGGYMA